MPEDTPKDPKPETPETVSQPVKKPTEPERPKPVEATETPTHSSAGVLVLQWLTYAFWGWLILALIWLMGVVLANAILDKPSTDMIPYAIAASIVLLPLAFVTDLFYRKHEPLKKVGGAAIIMVIHTVLFALLGIITLIITIFTALSMATETGGVDGKLVAIGTTGFATLLYAGAFIRTLNPFKNAKPLFIYSLVMVGLTALLLCLAIVGPFAKSLTTRNDRLIEQNLSSVENGITNYTRENKGLPNSLKDVRLSGEAKQLVDNNLVEYKKEATIKAAPSSSLGSITIEHRYQLCVTYTASNGSEYASDYQTEEEYTDYASTSSHEAGKTCYKLKATTYDYTKVE